ncbi:MAG: lecithin retinol acyltransferase family protein [Pseudomonas sp.]|nr:lecithin retinol acyltransferase family protein [Pseudomonas sp.]
MSSSFPTTYPNPGDVVVTDFTGYQHWSLVSDKLCEQGKPLLISATKRNGTVREEPWDTVTLGKETYVADVSYARPISEVLAMARSQIGQWRYSLTSNNCEHFVKWVAGLEVSSKQVVSGVAGALVGATAVGLIAEKPTTAKFLGGALLLGGLAVIASKASEKK